MRRQRKHRRSASLHAPVREGRGQYVPEHGGFGRDRVDPPLAKEFFDEGMTELAELYNEVGRAGVPPDEGMTPRVTVLPKTDMIIRIC